MIDTEKEYTISEISEITGYPSHVLRYYEKEFDLEIPRNDSNHRYFTYKELEKLNYIKALQEKGFTNKQIKLIMNSPEMLVNAQEEAAVTTVSRRNEEGLTPNFQDIYACLHEIIVEELQPKLVEKGRENIQAISELKEEIMQLRNEVNSKERDVLICENAKLKMKIKEKSYEVADLKERLKREQNSKVGILKKIFNKK